MSTEKQTELTPIERQAVGSSDLLAELEAELRRQDDFVKMLHSWTALPHIIGGAQRERARLQTAVESEKRRSANDQAQRPG